METQSNSNIKAKEVEQPAEFLMRYITSRLDLYNFQNPNNKLTINDVIAYLEANLISKKSTSVKHTLTAELRNALSPAYGLASNVIYLPKNAECEKLIRINAWQVEDNKGKIEELLTKIEELS